jgi:hypothetical protein
MINIFWVKFDENTIILMLLDKRAVTSWSGKLSCRIVFISRGGEWSKTTRHCFTTIKLTPKSPMKDRREICLCGIMSLWCRGMQFPPADLITPPLVLHANEPHAEWWPRLSSSVQPEPVNLPVRAHRSSSSEDKPCGIHGNRSVEDKSAVTQPLPSPLSTCGLALTWWSLRVFRAVIN